MRDILAVVKFSFLETLRERFSLVIIISAVGLLLLGFLVSSLGGEQPARIIFDVNIAGIEFLGMLVALFLFAGFMYREMEQRTIALTLVRPISSWRYLVGKFFGLYLAIGLLVTIGGFLNILLLLVRRAPITGYFSFLILALLKIFLISVVAIFFSFLTTSLVSSLVISFSFWILGHFSPEISFIGKYSRTLLPKIIARILGLILPNFSLYNWREMGTQVGVIDWSKIVIYTLIYGLSFFLGSYLLFRKKEF